jgi:hypothetical protein
MLPQDLGALGLSIVLASRASSSSSLLLPLIAAMADDISKWW